MLCRACASPGAVDASECVVAGRIMSRATRTISRQPTPHPAFPVMPLVCKSKARLDWQLRQTGRFPPCLSVKSNPAVAHRTPHAVTTANHTINQSTINHARAAL